MPRLEDSEGIDTQAALLPLPIEGSGTSGEPATIRSSRGRDLRGGGIQDPRYDLWLWIHDHGCDPEAMTTRATLAFCDGSLSRFLAERGLHLSPRAQRRLLRAVGRYDPDVPSPEELLFGTR